VDAYGTVTAHLVIDSVVNFPCRSATFVPRLELSLQVAAPPPLCFDLARSVDAHVRSTTATSERAVGGRTTGLLKLGDQVTWRARHLGVWQHLTSQITAFDRPRYFRDSMVRGAFARFDHDHYFKPVDGGTLMVDVFDYRAPFGPFGWLAERLFLSAYMRRFLLVRMHELKALAESSEWVEFVPDVQG
jgi:ligand-binding SRPBCC domain-containing protein